MGASRYLNAEDETDLALRRRDAVLVFILSVAIGVLGFLLVAAFILYFILRQQYASKRRSDELILKIHDHDSVSYKKKIITDHFLVVKVDCLICFMA